MKAFLFSPCVAVDDEVDGIPLTNSQEKYVLTVQHDTLASS